MLPPMLFGISLIYINFLITAGFIFVIGLFVQKFVTRLAKICNPLFGLIFGLLGGLVAMYFHWAVWVDLVLNISDTVGGDNIGMAISNIKVIEVFTLAFNPSALFGLISEIQEVGTWGIGGGTVSGVFLLLIWILELGIVVWLSAISPSAGARMPFSELQNTWYDENHLSPFDFISDPAILTQLIETDGLGIDDALNRPFGLNESHSVFTLYTCIEDAKLLAVENKVAKTNKKGEISFSDQEVIPPTYISESLALMLMNFRDERLETSAARDAFEKL